MPRSPQLQEMAASPAAFRRSVLIDADGAAVPFKPDDWQERDFAAMDPAWMSVAGRWTGNDGAVIRRAWEERPRGHSKSSDVALAVTWVLLFAKRAVNGIAAAGDTDQARLLRDAIERLCRCNRWMSDLLKVDRYEVKNVKTGSRLEIISSDASTSYGALADFIVCDELTHWRNDSLWISLFSAAAKKKHCVLVVIGNAGFLEEWPYKVREAVRSDASWYFSRLDGPQASWIGPALLQEQRRLLPPTAFARLWLNEWAAGSGDALSMVDVEAACKASGPMDGTEAGWVFVAGLDIGLSHDATALCVVGKQRDRYRLAALKLWRPGPGKRVDLEEVEAGILDVHQRFKLRMLGYDPFQAEYLAARVKKCNIPMQQITFGGSNLTAMATCVLDAFTSRNIELYREPQLMQDLARLRVVEKSYGMRLESPRGPTGHGDAATGLAIALLVGKDVISPHRKIGVW
jgi:phage terminase large subunit-like protein